MLILYKEKQKKKCGRFPEKLVGEKEGRGLNVMDLHHLPQVFLSFLPRNLDDRGKLFSPFASSSPILSHEKEGKAPLSKIFKILKRNEKSLAESKKLFALSTFFLPVFLSRATSLLIWKTKGGGKFMLRFFLLFSVACEDLREIGG
jgi:hypothetical protein